MRLPGVSWRIGMAQASEAAASQTNCKGLRQTPARAVAPRSSGPAGHRTTNPKAHSPKGNPAPDSRAESDLRRHLGRRMDRPHLRFRSRQEARVARGQKRIRCHPGLAVIPRLSSCSPQEDGGLDVLLLTRRVSRLIGWPNYLGPVSSACFSIVSTGALPSQILSSAR